MTLTIKMMVAGCSWTAAIGTALFATFDREGQGLTIWATLTALFAALATLAVVIDIVAERSAKYVVHKVAEEGNDELVERLALMHEDALERMAAEIAEALREGEPTRIH